MKMMKREIGFEVVWSDMCLLVVLNCNGYF